MPLDKYCSGGTYGAVQAEDTTQLIVFFFPPVCLASHPSLCMAKAKQKGIPSKDKKKSNQPFSIQPLRISVND